MRSFTPFDVADYLKTEDDQAAYLEAALEEGQEAFQSALVDVARVLDPGSLQAVLDKLAGLPVLDGRTPDQIIGYNKSGTID
jgi:hypothetical protein